PSLRCSRCSPPCSPLRRNQLDAPVSPPAKIHCEKSRMHATAMSLFRVDTVGVVASIPIAPTMKPREKGPSAGAAVAFFALRAVHPTMHPTSPGKRLADACQVDDLRDGLLLLCRRDGRIVVLHRLRGVPRDRPGDEVFDLGGSG